ncbi:MAG: hypothetical protein AAFR90_06385 [Pseudomonadota bacterium]
MACPALDPGFRFSKQGDMRAVDRQDRIQAKLREIMEERRHSEKSAFPWMLMECTPTHSSARKKILHSWPQER